MGARSFSRATLIVHDSEDLVRGLCLFCLVKILMNVIPHSFKNIGTKLSFFASPK